MNTQNQYNIAIGVPLSRRNRTPSSATPRIQGQRSVLALAQDCPVAEVVFVEKQDALLEDVVDAAAKAILTSHLPVRGVLDFGRKDHDECLYTARARDGVLYVPAQDAHALHLAQQIDLRVQKLNIDMLIRPQPY